MRDRSITPSISVDFGGQLRIYHAFVTTAPPALDGPATLTLHISTFANVAGFGADPSPFQAEFGRTTARLVLIDATELAWHRPLSLQPLPARGPRSPGARSRCPGVGDATIGSPQPAHCEANRLDARRKS